MINNFLEEIWLKLHLQEIKKKAGSRYTPKLNVNLPITEVFYGLGRTNEFYVLTRSHLGKFNKSFRYASSIYQDKSTQNIYNKLQKEASILVGLLSEIKEYDSVEISWTNIATHAKRTRRHIWKIIEKLREQQEKLKQEVKTEQKKQGLSNTETIGSNIHYFFEAQRELNFFEEFSSSTTAKLSNKPYLLLSGLAGSGKTHLLCDVIESRIKKIPSLPSIFVFGEFFANGKDPFEQTIHQLGLNLNKKKFLHLLDEAGKKRRARALLVIDAINETRDRNFWKKNLENMVNEVKKYPNIALVISIRSGFEHEILSLKQKKMFIHEEHRGFRFREWEAVSKFFKEFNLPFPEIPLLMPEFQNPLFLLLFCKAFEERSRRNYGKKRKEIFRGHEGATFIFETFVDSVSKRIAKKFKISGLGVNIWDTVIEKAAEEMINNSDDRIPESKLIEIVSNSYPTVKSADLIKELERNLLMIKVPDISKPNFNFRFPFQKFSDHLLGRFIFKKYEQEFGKSNKDLKKAKRFFSKRRKLGKYLSDYWNRGIVEALSIQCPEYLKGYELIDVAPYLKTSPVAQEAFIESLIWRKPTAFLPNLSNTLDFINNYVNKTQNGNNNLLNAFLAIAPVPVHPFNGDFLHKHLLRFSMPQRDSWWSVFLHRQYGNKGTVDRLIEWAWSDQDRSQIKNDTLRLYAIPLVWFLSTSNRFLRDKATKALVSLLSDKLDVILDLLKLFDTVNDPYVLERLYAVAYGCAVRTRNSKQNLENLAVWIYEINFKKRKPPIDILVRDYARGVIEVALNRGAKINVDRKKIMPPFKSNWPKRIPSEKTLKEKYYPSSYIKSSKRDRGFLDIWSSVMYTAGSLADFGNYVLDSAIHSWSGRRLNKNDVNRKLLFEAFKKNLSKKQKNLLTVATNPFYGISSRDMFKYIKLKSYSKKPEDEVKIKEEKEREEREREKLLNNFEGSLGNRKRDFFNKEVKPYLSDRGGVIDPLERFNEGMAQRWLFNRVVKLGWTYKLHGEFDGNVNYSRADRSDHKAERIGKKYQWIALHELLARISDNFEFKEESWLIKSTDYHGPWQMNVRDIDPTCILKEYPNKIPENMPSFNNHRALMLYNAWNKKISDLAWLKTKDDLPSSKEIIEITDDKGEKWLILEGFMEWQKETDPEHEKFDLPTRTLWYMFKSYLVKKSDSKKAYDWAKKQNFMGRWMPESHEFYDIYLGEFPWAPAFIDHYIPYFHHDEWTNGGLRNEKIPAKILVTDDEYLSSGSSTDCSTDEAIRIKIPAKWIVDGMELDQKYIDGRFFSKNGDLVAFDPSVFYENFAQSQCLLIRKDKLEKFLKEKGYSILWTVLGEKNIIGGRDLGQSSGRLEITGAYTLNEKFDLIGSVKNKFNKF